MKTVFQRVFPRVAMGLACAVGLSSGVARADEHVLILLDRTGSMGTLSAGGMTRLALAKKRISDFLDIVPSTPTKYAFWTFEGTTFTPVFTFAQNKNATDIKTALGPVVTGGDTPLARSICAAVDDLINFLPNEFHTKRIYLATDGLENNTPLADQCYGPNSATAYPTLQTNSWQWKVRNKACTGNANAPGPCSSGIPPAGLTLIADIDHLFDNNIPLRAEDPSERGGTASGFAALTPADDAAFFGGLSRETKGRYVGITQSTPLSQAAPVPGDVNADGCVNVTDRSLVLAKYGQTVVSGTPEDFNRDRIVNIYDYNTVLQNYGRGCTP